MFSLTENQCPMLLSPVISLSSSRLAFSCVTGTVESRWWTQKAQSAPSPHLRLMIWKAHYLKNSCKKWEPSKRFLNPWVRTVLEALVLQITSI